MKVGMLFPGYGSQYVGMGKALYDGSRIMQEYFEQASNCLDINFVKLCFASSDLELGKMSNAYASIFLLSSAIFKILQEDEGIMPDIVAGYNVGEFSAVQAAGGISFADGLYLINKYASFYEEFLANVNVSLVRVLGVKGDVIKEICEQHSTNDNFASVAIYNTDVDIIVSGNTQVVEQVSEALKKYAEAKIEPLGVEYGLHSSLMRPVFDSLKLYLGKIDFKDVKEFPVLSSTQINTIKSGDSLKACILENITSPLLWQQSLDYLHVYDVLVEVGPGSKLSNMAKIQYPDKKILSINNGEDIDELVKIVTSEKIEIDASEE